MLPGRFALTDTAIPGADVAKEITPRLSQLHDLQFSYTRAALPNLQRPTEELPATGASSGHQRVKRAYAR
jgi:hypothetical protein